MEIGLLLVSAFKFLKWTGNLAFSPTEAFKKLLPILESRPIALATSDTSAPVASQIALMALMLEIRCARKALAACRERSTWFEYRALTKVFSSWSPWKRSCSFIQQILLHTHHCYFWLIFTLRVASWFYCSCQLKRQAASLCNWLDCYLAWANLSFGRGTAKLCRKCGGDALKFLLEPLVLTFVAAVKNCLNGTGPTYVGSLFKYTCRHTLPRWEARAWFWNYLTLIRVILIQLWTTQPRAVFTVIHSYIVPACYT